MIHFIGGFLVGMALGWYTAVAMVRIMFISGRITTREIAEKIDQFLDAADQVEEERPVRRGTLS